MWSFLTNLIFFQRSVARTLQNVCRSDVPGFFPTEGAQTPADLGGADKDTEQIRAKCDK